jgi:hypothetical protein
MTARRVYASVSCIQPAASVPVADCHDFREDRQCRLLRGPRAQSNPTGVESRSSSSVRRPALSSRSRRLDCARRDPIAPTNAPGERRATMSAASSSLGSCVSAMIDVAGSIPPRRARFRPCSPLVQGAGLAERPTHPERRGARRRQAQRCSEADVGQRSRLRRGGTDNRSRTRHFRAP